MLRPLSLPVALVVLLAGSAEDSGGAGRLMAGVPSSHSEHGAICSVREYPTVRASGTTAFIGRARPDTVLAGAGEVEFVIGPGHFGPPGSRAIHGQLVEVERFGAATGLDAASHPVAVVVPWDYDPACRTTPWTASARFLDVGRRGVYRVRERPREHWVEGLPTFDAFFPQIQGFPGGTRISRDRGPTLSVDQFFELYELLPSEEELREAHWAAAEPVMVWARESPERLALYPAEEVVRGLAYAADRARARHLDVPVAGTYEVVVHLPSGSSERFYLRTAAAPAGAWLGHGFPRTRSERGPPWAPRAVGYDLYFWHAEDPRELPSDSADAERRLRGEWPLNIAEIPEWTEDALTWRGEFEPPQLTRLFPLNTELEALIGEWRRRYRAGEAGYDPVVFSRASSGAVGFEMVMDLDDRGILRMVGRRISTQTVTDRIR